LFDGAVQLATIDPFWGTTLLNVGAPGTTLGVPFTAEEAVPSPTLLVAVTVTA
jgi:hypothetical protein